MTIFQFHIDDKAHYAIHQSYPIKAGQVVLKNDPSEYGNTPNFMDIVIVQET